MLRNTVCDGVGRLYVEKTLVGAVTPIQKHVVPFNLRKILE